ncbi:MAG: winged helix-turn-helix transcriptional regulator [Lactobacillaceae bacterium]|nr:winged helix-turn-helix transcriptional regulator [Lactobacillaceae bacterium]
MHLQYYPEWSLTTLRIIKDFEVCAYNEFLSNINGLSRKMLSVRLKQLLAWQLISRDIVETVPLRVKYSITDKGISLLDALDVFKNQLD